jgi:hypothetical protein
VEISHVILICIDLKLLFGVDQPEEKLSAINSVGSHIG